MNFQDHQQLEMHNVLLFRGKLTQEQALILNQNIGEIIARSGVKRQNIFASCTHAAYVDNGELVIDLELLVPLEQPIVVSEEGFSFLPEFVLKNAISVCAESNPRQLQIAVHHLKKYIQEHNLQPTSNAYFVINGKETDIYLSVAG